MGNAWSCRRRPGAYRVAVEPRVDVETGPSAREPEFRRRLSGTDMSMDFEMWVMPLSEFMKMTVFEPHEQLRAAGRVVRWDSSMPTTWCRRE